MFLFTAYDTVCTLRSCKPAFIAIVIILFILYQNSSNSDAINSCGKIGGHDYGPCANLGEFLCQSQLSPLPQNTRNKVVDTFLPAGSLCSLANEFDKFIRSTVDSFTVYKISPSPSARIIYHYWYPIIGLNKTTYDVLMLKFTNGTGQIPTKGVDYSIKINGTKFSFKGNGSTTTGADMQIINNTMSSKDLLRNVNLEIKVTRFNGDVVNERNIQLQSKQK
jgi:hypothetical protein